MRTTLTIDDDLAVMIERLRRDKEAKLKDVINDALQRGLREMTTKKKRRKLFHTEPLEGLVPLMNMDNIAEVIAAGEGEAFK